MVLLTITTDWISAIASTLALGFTAYAIYDTRRNAADTQNQVDSLASLAYTYQKSRRDDIMPDIIVEHSSYGDGVKNSSLIILTNNGDTAINFEIIKAEYVGHFDIPVGEPIKNFYQNKYVSIRYSIDGMNYQEHLNKLPIKIYTKFNNRDNEHFLQQFEVTKAERIAYPPHLTL